MRVFLAIDLGAGSGRVMAVVYDDRMINLEQVHRFESPAIEEDGSLLWDLHLIWNEIKVGLRKAAQSYGSAICSIGVDSWGVDYAWLDRDGELMRQPYCYRDTRNVRAMNEVCESLGRQFIFGRTGVQFMPINTLYQWHADLHHDPGIVNRAGCFLMIADTINYWLTGRMACERTNASTTQLYDPRSRNWSKELAGCMGLPVSVLPPLIDPGTVISRLKSDVAAEIGLSELPVVAVGSHDTASAVAGVPATSESFAYLSCGTWALLGTELSEPLITDAVLKHNFTNETGVDHTFRLLKNITGLWITQECRRVWRESDGIGITYDELMKLTESAEPFAAFIDPDAAEFSHRGDHPAAIQTYCQQTGQSIPNTRGEILRIASESLALKVATTLEQLESLLEHSLEVLHVIGGGVNDTFLVQCVANATQRRVIAGPVEATALGNAMVQMMACGEVESLTAGRALLDKLIETTSYEPTESWDSARKRFRELLENHPPEMK